MSTHPPDWSAAQWYACKGCGAPCAVLPTGIAHAKPDHLEGIPNSVPCALYQACTTVAFFLEHMAGEPMGSPTEIRRGSY